MERALFQLDGGRTTIPCLLNPEDLVIRRSAGVRTRSLTEGQMCVSSATYDPLLYTGGGSAEITLHLLFDVSLLNQPTPSPVTDSSMPGQQPAPPIEDVRDLTRPLMALASPQEPQDAVAAPLARFLWGKAWNLLGLVTAVAERLEYFTDAGVPQRSFLALRLMQVDDREAPESEDPSSPISGPDFESPASLDPDATLNPDDLRQHDVLSDGAATGEDSDSERPDQIATAEYGSPSLWRLITEYNNIDDPLTSLGGRSLLIPPRSAGGTA